MSVIVRIHRLGGTETVADLHRRMEQVMRRLLVDDRPSPTVEWVPRADVFETEAGVTATIELPGIEREKIEIVVEGSYIKVSGVRQEPAPGGCIKWHQMEIGHGPFERILALPPEADVERITASYSDGFLEILMPRAGASRSVPIRGA